MQYDTAFSRIRSTTFNAYRAATGIGFKNSLTFP